MIERSLTKIFNMIGKVGENNRDIGIINSLLWIFAGFLDLLWVMTF